MARLNAETFPIYFLYGPEDYLIEEEVQRLLHQTLPPRERGLNFHLFNGREHSGLEIIQTAQTLPMFSSRRFVHVQEADQFDEENVEALLQYIRNPSPTTCLVMCGQTPGLWKRYQKVMDEAGKVMEFARLKGKGLVSWVRKQMDSRGKTISEEAAGYLVEVTGDHLQDLNNSLEKIYLSAGEKRNIGLPDVEGVTPEVKISTVFDLTDAIGQQDLEKALGILKKALESKTIPFKKEEETSKKKNDPVPLLLGMMARHYWNIWRVKEVITGRKSFEEMAQTLRIQAWNLKKLIDQGKSFSVSSLREGILKCHQVDIAIKGSQGPKNLLMEKLVIDLCRPGPYQRLSLSSSRRGERDIY